MTVYYIIADDVGTVKIGHGNDPTNRLRNLQTGSSALLRLVAIEPGGVDREVELHAMFADEHVRGEWFTLSDRLRAHIDTLPPFIGKRKGPSIQQMLIAIGCSKGLASQACSPKWPQRITIPMAVSVFRAFGARIGPLEGAEDHEIDTLDKFVGRWRRKQEIAA